MNANTTAVRATRNAVVLATVPLALLLMSGTASATGTSGDANRPQPLSHADRTGNGANPGTLDGCGAYCSTRDGSPSQNGRSTDNSSSKPCAGCVGKADNKNPKGQAPSGPVDHNAGYECDRNQGVGQSNPAHTGCTASAPPVTPPATTPVPPTVTPPATTPVPPTVTPPVTPPAGPVVPPVVSTPVSGPAAPSCSGGSAGSNNGNGCTPVAPVAPVVTNPVTAPVVVTPAVPAAPALPGIPAVAAPVAVTPTSTSTGNGSGGVVLGSTGATPTVVTVKPAARPVARPASATFGSGTVTPNGAGTVSVGGASLPRTGDDTALLGLLGMLLAGTGGALVAAGRRTA